MSKTHLAHLIPWEDLLFVLSSEENPGIELPICECGIIHMVNKKTKIKVERHKYLSKFGVCTSLDCKTVGKKKFYKREKISIPDLSYRKRHLTGEKEERLLRFIEKFAEAVIEFATIERNKYPEEMLKKEDCEVKEYLKKEKEHERRCLLDESYDYLSYRATDFGQRLEESLDLMKKGIRDKYFPRHTSAYFWPLIFQLDVKTILQLNRHGLIDIQDEFSITYGGQSVGVGSRFLFLCHLLPAYFITNAIIAAGYEKDQCVWSTNIIRFMQKDYDFFTCPYPIRSYIKPESYFVNLEETDEFLKKSFRYFYLYHLLWVESGLKEAKLFLCRNILYSLSQSFDINYYDLVESLFSRLKV